MINQDLIYALATPYQSSALAIIRLSGEGCFNKFRTLLPNIKQDPENRRIYLTDLYYPNSPKMLDQITFVKYDKKSFTGEELVEIFIHGSIAVIDSISDILSAIGFRLANPGEFSLRAYHNQKISINQAEGIASLISSVTKKEADLAVYSLNGSIDQKIIKLYNNTQNLKAKIDASLDFIEEDIELISKTEIGVELSKLLEEIEGLLGNYQNLKSNGDNFKVVIIGLPNAGKSSFFNDLVGYSRSIVSDINGTTRDFIKENIIIDEISFDFYDTAGIHSSDNVIELEGIKRSQDLLKTADLILLITEYPNVELSQKLLSSEIRDETVLTVISKSDQLPQKSLQKNLLYYSVYDQKSKQQIYQAIVKQLKDKEYLGGLISRRQANILLDCQEIIARLVDESEGLEDNLVSLELNRFLGELTKFKGNNIIDDTVNEIFKNFCIGK